MISERISQLREQHNLTQESLAKKLNITRSSVNAWEQGISVPSIQYVVEIATLFSVSTDYVLGIDKKLTVDISDLTMDERKLICGMLTYFKKRVEK